MLTVVVYSGSEEYEKHHHKYTHISPPPPATSTSRDPSRKSPSGATLSSVLAEIVPTDSPPGRRRPVQGPRGLDECWASRKVMAVQGSRGWDEIQSSQYRLLPPVEMKSSTDVRPLAWHPMHPEACAGGSPPREVAGMTIKHTVPSTYYTDNLAACNWDYEHMGSLQNMF